MPIMLAKGLRYIHRFHEKLNSEKLNSSFHSQVKKPAFDFHFIRDCLIEMLNYYERRSEKRNKRRESSNSVSV